MSPPPSSPPAEQAATPPRIDRSPVPMRSVYAKQARALHPDLTPKDDYEILMLGSDDLKGYTTDAKRAWLSEEWTETVDEYGSEAEARQGIKEYLDAMVEPSGDKPTSDDPDVGYIPIPQTNLTLRFWPGSLAEAEYCMDFVVTATRTPVNVPDDYHVWIVPDPAMPWVQATMTEVLSIEKIHGIHKNDIKEGCEKFILRDGLYCQLAYKDQSIMRFRVPARAQAFVDDDITTYHPQP
ncbi:hypothetical protein TRAPUB_3136 [Trametes pubescens]|uniref:Uncharacterized protein n=1 Tax=Trametes pubescens TaxID=154538 RepID=A0A1M2VEA8_TRAPU|nr:hypothetical protein TRAPUB_3136 [Trametes pubescens]